MATLGKTIDNLTRLLDDAGVTDGGELERQGYGIGARALFVEAAARGMRSRPRRDWNEADIVAKARLFVTTMPGLYAGNEDASYPMPNGDYLVQNRWTTGLSLGRKPASWSSKVVRPSVAAEEVITELGRDYDHVALRARAERIASEAGAAMGIVLGSLMGEAGVTVSRPHRHGYAFSMRLASGQPWIAHVDNARLMHDADVKLLEPFISYARGIVVGEADLATLSGRLDLQRALDEHAASTGFPISLRLAPNPRTTGAYASPSFAVLLEGYGPTGAPDVQVACVLYRDPTVESLRSQLKCSDPLNAQPRLHAEFGPRPGANVADLTMDAPTARRLAATGRGAQIARSAASGAADGGEADVSFRVKGRAILGTFEIAPGVIWKGDRIDVQMTRISDVMAAALPGRSLRDVVEHPVFAETDVVRRIQQRDTKTANTLVVHATTGMIAIDQIDALAA
jgi:hypothetical protein